MPYQSLNPGPEGDVRDWEIMYVDQADNGEQPMQQRHFYGQWFYSQPTMPIP